MSFIAFVLGWALSGSRCQVENSPSWNDTIDTRLLRFMMGGDRTVLDYNDTDFDAPLESAVRKGYDLSGEEAIPILFAFKKTVNVRWRSNRARSQEFRVASWPKSGEVTYGFVYKIHGTDVMWAKVEGSYVLFMQPHEADIVAVSSNGPSKEYVIGYLNKLFNLSRSVSKAKVTMTGWDGHLSYRLGTIRFTSQITKSAFAPPKWDDSFQFCTDGDKIFFVFGGDRSLVDAARSK
jgi:hypothetical protein